MSWTDRTSRGTKFEEYITRLHSEKNPFQHKCTLDMKSSGVKEQARKKLGNPAYVYLIMLPYDHYETKVYYDSFDSVDQSRRDHANNYPFILHPFSRLRIFYDAFIIIPYLSVRLSFGIAPSFGVAYLQKYYEIIAIIFATIGIIYILLNFLTGYCIRKARRVEMNPKKIAKHYLLTFFVVDISMLILDLLILFYGDDLPVYSFFLFILPFFRCITLFKIIKNTLLVFSVRLKTVNRITLLILIIMILQVYVSIMGLMQHFLGHVKQATVWDDWRKDFVAYIEEYVTAMSRLYYSALFAKPSELFVTLLILCSVLLGTLGFSYILATILMDILGSVAQESKYHQLAMEVQNFARQDYRDPAIRKRIVQMFDVIFLGTLLKEQRVKHTVPDNIRRDLNAETIGVLIKGTAVLSQLDDYLLLRILDKLKLVVLLPNDHLVTEGQFGDSMYLLSSGRLVIYYGATELGHLDDGDSFAEDALLSEEYIYPETVIAGTACFVYKLSRSDYISIFKL